MTDRLPEYQEWLHVREEVLLTALNALLATERFLRGNQVGWRSWWCLYLSKPGGKEVLELLSAEYGKSSMKGFIPLIPHDDIKPPPPKPTIDDYRQKVDSVTRKQPLDQLPGIHLRGKGWELDHVYPVSRGFKDGVPPEKIGHISNLSMVPMVFNRLKAGAHPVEFFERHLSSQRT